MTGAELACDLGQEHHGPERRRAEARSRRRSSAQGMEVISIASPILKCVLPDAPDVDTRFQQDIFASKHTFEDQPRLAEHAFKIAKLMDAKIIRVFSYWRSVEPDKCFDGCGRSPDGSCRKGRERRPDHRARERARLQRRHRGGIGASLDVR